MNFFFTMGSIACAMLYFFNQQDYTLIMGLGLYVLSLPVLVFGEARFFIIHFFRKSQLPEDRDRISAKGFAYGYVGSVLLQLICFVFVLIPGIVGSY